MVGDLPRFEPFGGVGPSAWLEVFRNSCSAFEIFADSSSCTVYTKQTPPSQLKSCKTIVHTYWILKGAKIPNQD
jgi:hypothetical protein